MDYNFIGNRILYYRSRRIIALPTDESSKATTDDPKYTFLAPRARHDRARSEAIFRKASPITLPASGLPIAPPTVSFSDETEMIPSSSRSYKTLSAVNKSIGKIDNDLYRSVLNGSIFSHPILRESRSGRDQPTNSISSTSSRITYFHHPTNIIKSSMRSRSILRNNY